MRLQYRLSWRRDYTLATHKSPAQGWTVRGESASVQGCAFIRTIWMPAAVGKDAGKGLRRST